MEDNSYVNLSLEKYNELYDKAKKYDELKERYKEPIEKTLDRILKNINDRLDKMSTNEEEPNQEAEQEDTELKVGDKVKLVKLGRFVHGFNKGDICTITNLHFDDSKECIEIIKDVYLKGFVSEKQIEKIKEEK